MREGRGRFVGEFLCTYLLCSDEVNAFWERGNRRGMGLCLRFRGWRLRYRESQSSEDSWFCCCAGHIYFQALPDVRPPG